MINGRLHIRIHYDDCRCQRIDHKIGYSIYDPYHGWIDVKDEKGNQLYTGDMGPDALSILRWVYSYSGRSMYEWEEYCAVVISEDSIVDIITTQTLYNISDDSIDYL